MADQGADAKMEVDEAQPVQPAQPQAQAQEQPQPPQDLGEDISTNKDGGLYKKILVVGGGDERPGPSSKVSVHYTGSLMDGTVFDSSVERSELFTFKLGQGKVIKGWDVGVATMRKGERCLLTCSPDYAYGEAGSPPKIPPDATLQFEVELVKWISGEDLTKDKGVVKIIVAEGKDFSKVSDGSYCEVHIVGTCGGTEFEDRVVSFDQGEGSEVGIVPGLEVAIGHMRKKEVARVLLKPEYAFGKEGNEELGVPPNASVEYTVTVKTFEKPKEPSEYESVELKKIDAMQFKDRGSNYFKQGKYKLALKLYERGEKLVDESSIMGADDKVFVSDIQLLLKLNLAAVHLKCNEPHKALIECNTVLDKEKDNVKALYRRASAHMQLQEYTEAIGDFKEVQRLEPGNKAAQAQIERCKKQIKTQENKEKKMYAGMLGSLSSPNDKPKTEKKSEETPQAAQPS